MKTLMLPLLFVLVSLPPTTVLAKEWQMIAGDSRLEYVATYEGQEAPGEFRSFEAKLDFNPGAPGAGRLDVHVNLASADMYSSDVNEAIMEREWLDSKNVGPAEFTSSDIARVDGDRFVARGTLQVKGVEANLELPFTWERHGSEATMDGAITIDRTRFNIGTGEWASPTPIGVKVEVKFHVRFKPTG